MIIAPSFCGAFVGHLVGDYLLQNDHMAQGKKKSSFICAIHCAIWTICVMVHSGWIRLPGWPWWWLPLVLFGTHFVQDRTKIVNRYMKFFGQSAFASPPLAPWSIIVVDNVFHILVLYWVAIIVR